MLRIPHAGMRGPEHFGSHEQRGNPMTNDAHTCHSGTPAFDPHARCAVCDRADRGRHQ